MLISIIIPCHNVQDYIEECVASAFDQTYKNIEVICIDNNSTDQTWAKLLEIKSKYPQLVIDKETKPGAPAARNKGLSLANGEWIQFLDADDLLLPEKIAHQVSFINDSMAFIVGACISKSKSGETKSIPDKSVNIWENLAKVRLGNTCSNLFSKQHLLSVSGWDVNLKSSQEYDLMFRILQKNSHIYYDAVPLTVINQIDNSITRNPENIVSNIVRRANLLNRIRQYTLQLNTSRTVTKEIEQALFDVIREMYLYDSLQSKNMYKQFFETGYKPTSSSATSAKYVFLHSIMGFKLANFLIMQFKGRNNN